MLEIFSRSKLAKYLVVIGESMLPNCIHTGDKHPVAELIESILGLPEEERREALEKLVTHEDAATRARSLVVSERLFRTSVSDICRQLLHDPVWFVRMRACECAMRNQVSNLINSMIELLTNDDNEDVRPAAAIALEKIATVDYLDRLQNLMPVVTGENHDGTSVKDLLLMTIENIRSKSNGSSLRVS